MKRRELAFILNNLEIRSTQAPGTSLVDFIRGECHLTGTRIGCREGDCGACSVLLGSLHRGRMRYRAVASCLFPLADAAGCHVVTIEGLNSRDLTPVQRAFVKEGASQCGFCTPGLVVSLTAFLLSRERLQEEEALTAIEGNICRCTGYSAIRRAVSIMLEELRPRLSSPEDRLEALIESGVIPDYFTGIPDRLRGMATGGYGDGNEAPEVVVAGGTDLYVQRGPELPDMKLLLVGRRQGYAEIRKDSQQIYIGAASTVTDMMESILLKQQITGLEEALHLVSSRQIRNRATVGGNIVNASPIGDLNVMFLALDADIGLESSGKSRDMKLRDFFLEYKKLALRPSELVAWLRIPILQEKRLFHFEKVSRRKHQDIASVNTAISLEMDGDTIISAHAAAGGVAPVPRYLSRASGSLVQKRVSADAVGAFLDLADTEVSPISDVRGSASYKRTLLRRLLFAHFLTLFPEQIRPGDLK